MASVNVIGGGPAGLFSAISSAREGHIVSLFEEHKEIGIPVNCTGLVSKTGLDEISEFVDYKKCVLSEMRGARIFAGKSELKVDTGKTMAHVIDRAYFDQLCAERAEEEGVEIFLGRKGGEKELAGVDAIVGADGPASFVARHFSFPKISFYANTYQEEFLFEPEKKLVHVYLSNKEFPGFFGWVVPACDGYSRVGVGVTLPHNSRKSFDAFVKRLGIGEVKRRNVSSAVIPLEIRKKTAGRFDGSRAGFGGRGNAGKKNIMLVGDAAGQVKSSTGGGIVFGCLCGKIAGRNIGNPENYEKEWRKKYEADLKAHYLVRRAMDKMSDSVLEKVVRIAGAAKADKFLERHGHMDMPMKMIGGHALMDYLKIIAFG